MKLIKSQVEDTFTEQIGSHSGFDWYTQEYRTERNTVVAHYPKLNNSFYQTTSSISSERGDLGVIVNSKTAEYDVSELVAEALNYRLYICKDVTSGQQALLQVATEVVQNGGLERAAFILRMLKQTSDLFEAEYARRGGEGLLSYERLFPGVLDSFISEDQGKRRLNVLSISEVEDVHRLVPLSNLMDRSNLRIALPSSAWVMGRLLKLLAFAHGENIAVRGLTRNNILVEPERHFVVVLDWTQSLTEPAGISSTPCKDDISSAAKAVFSSIGGNPDTGDFPYDGDRRYVDFIWRLASRRESNAERAHDQFYELVDELWGRKFRPFETLPR